MVSSENSEGYTSSTRRAVIASMTAGSRRWSDRGQPICAQPRSRCAGSVTRVPSIGVATVPGSAIGDGY